MSSGQQDDNPDQQEPSDSDNATLPSDTSILDAEHLPPPELLARYTDVRRIGEGSMGTVYRAKDPRLGRLVAIKVLKSDDPVDTRRFLREAQAQARVQHENVCRVYEVEETERTPYIVMELIQGEPLDRAHHRMTLEQKVKVIRECASALHEAHRLGLIHRDVKPGNIMITTLDDGSPKPFIVDFGLARDVSTTGASTQNGIVGTPAYMSPEQAEGTSTVLDRRTDVYSLGATLYDILAGRTPFVGSNALTLLTQVIYDEAPALGSIRRGIPKQLEIIVMTCLQREPERRYASARAFGEDLQRFLDGGQIQAKPPPWTYVLLRRARRHKTVVAIAALGLAIAVVLGANWIHAARQVAKQAELARELGEDVKYVELFLRSAYGMPIHDIEREHRVVRVRLGKIAERMAEAGSLGEGPGHYALGRGHLALHEYNEAQKHLESSLASHYEKPEVHYALGVTLGERYRIALDEALRIGDDDAREATIRNAEKTYQIPALKHLRASEGTEVESGAYIDGLVALYEKRYEDAARLASVAMDESPWFYEAKKLEGDAHFASGIRESDSGHKENGQRLLHLAVAAYAEAAAIATSDASIHESLAGAWVEILKFQTWEGAPPYQDAFAAVLKACADASKSNPRVPGPYTKQSQASTYVGQYELRTGADPRKTLQQAIDSARSARKIAPDDAISADGIGNAFSHIADYERKLGLNPLPHLEEAIANLDEATRIQPAFAWAWNDAGVAYQIRAEYELAQGITPHSAMDSSVARFRRATETDPHYIGGYANATYMLGVRAGYELSNGRDPRPDVKKAIESADQGAKVDPTWLALLNNRGWAELVAAQYEEITGADPSKTLDNVEKSFQASLDINKDEADTQNGMGSAKHVRALYEIRNHRDPQKYLDEARSFLTRAAELDSSEPAIRLELGKLFLTMARLALAEKHEASVFLKDAEKAIREGLHINARHAPLHALLAETLAMFAEFDAKNDKDRAKHIADGLSAAEEALRHNPQWAFALAAKGTLYALRANMKKDDARSADVQLAIEALNKAFAIHALLPQRLKDRLQTLRSDGDKRAAAR